MVDLKSNMSYKGPQGNIVPGVFHLPTTKEDERDWQQSWPTRWELLNGYHDIKHLRVIATQMEGLSITGYLL